MKLQFMMLNCEIVEFSAIMQRLREIFCYIFVFHF